MAIAEAWVYLVLITTLTASASGDLIVRLGSIARIRAHRRTSRKLIDDAFERDNPTLTVIVPSLREEPRVVRQTLLSAALQEHPGIRVTLLVDDPPNPETAERADRVNLGRVSIWSANRDGQCAAQADGGWRVLPTCSGVEQEPTEFTRELVGRLDGSPPGPRPAARGADRARRAGR